MRPKHSNNGKRNVGFYSFSPNMQDYLYNVANVYHMISGNISMRIGNEEITLGDEGKKLFALYLAAGFNSVYDSKTKTMLHNSLAYREVYSRFGKSGVFKSKKENISQDEVSEIISQDFSELLNDRSNEFCNMKYLTIPALITMQTLKVAKSGEVNPIYWSCKMIDGIKGTNLAEDYVSNGFSMYQDAVKRDYLSVKWPLTRGILKKKVSIEGKKNVTNSPKQDKQGSKVDQTVEDNTEAVQEYSDEEIKEHIRKLDEEREKRIKLLNQQEQDRAREFRQFQSRLNEAARPIQQSTVAQLDKLLTQQGYDTRKFRTGTAGSRPGTSDLGEMGKMFGDKSIGDTSKSDDKGRHL